MRANMRASLLLAVAVMEAAIASDTVDLTKAWRFRSDPENEGLTEGWHQPGHTDSTWAVIEGGKRWEDQGYRDLDGHAWYRRAVVVPKDWEGQAVWLNLGAVNDACTIFWNGKRVATYGDADIHSVAALPLAENLTPFVRFGESNLIAIRVFDWGGSGGLWRPPCELTIDRKALAVNALLQCALRYEQQRLLVGLNLVMAGAGETEDAVLCAKLTWGTEERTVFSGPPQFDRADEPVCTATFDLPELAPGTELEVKASAVDKNRKPVNALVLERRHTWPEESAWEGDHASLKVLNNFVTELLHVSKIPGDTTKERFANPRDGWVFIALSGGSNSPRAWLDDSEEPLVWRANPDSGAFEAMQHLGKGDHRIRLASVDGMRLEVRAVPEIAFCYYPTFAVIEPLGPRDRAYMERHVFPQTNVLLTHGKMAPGEFEAWRREGRQWLSNSSLLGLSDLEPPTADAVYDTWATNRVVTEDGYAGIIVDEFLTASDGHYAAWGEAVARLHANPDFEGKTYYAWCVDAFKEENALAFLEDLEGLGGRFAWERYLHEQPTEELALLDGYTELKQDFVEWRDLMPGLAGRLTMCLGSFSTPFCSLNIDPGVNYLAWMDRQFQLLATEPEFFGLYGIFHWAAHYTDDDAIRYAQKLFRHYCIEGNRELFSTLPYTLAHLDNPDFADGLDGWQVEPATEGGVSHETMAGFGALEGRWSSKGKGDAHAVMTRNAERPNRVSQTLKDLEPGKLYSLKLIAGDMDYLGEEKKIPLHVSFNGAEIVEDKRTFRFVYPSSYALEIGPFNRANRAYLTYHQVLFRPGGKQAKVTISDWDGDKGIAGPAGQRVGFNFIEVQPYFE